MIDIINYVSSKGWVMKFLPEPYKIVVNFHVVISGIVFGESCEISKLEITEEELNDELWRSINRLNQNIKRRLPGYGV